MAYQVEQTWGYNVDKIDGVEFGNHKIVYHDISCIKHK